MTTTVREYWNPASSVTASESGGRFPVDLTQASWRPVGTQATGPHLPGLARVGPALVAFGSVLISPHVPGAVPGYSMLGRRE